MTIYKADTIAADRALNRATSKAIAMFRSGHDRTAVLPVLEAAVVTAALLTEDVS
jgi:hypothetical protein